MTLSIAEICRFTLSTPSCRNFVEGEKVLHAGHILFCGRQPDDEMSIKIIAFCLQSSSLRDTPHEISAEINFEGEIKDAKCSCKAGLSEKCKHVVAVLLHLHTTDYKSLEVASCTDTKCLWNTPQAEVLANYEPAPLRNHNCFTNAFDKEYDTKISEEDEQFIKNLLYNSSMESALTKHMCGRHEPVVPDLANNNVVNNSAELEALLQNLPSQSMKNLGNVILEEETRTCCQSFLSRLVADTRSICEETKCNRVRWLEERLFRLTGSRCYAIYTYYNNKSPDWEQKSQKYFYPKRFKATPAMKHGIENEQHAREIYMVQKEAQVIQFGLIVPSENPWLGYSPDGVVFKDGNPEKLIEIKCPYSGRTKTAEEILNDLKYVKLPEKTLKEKHEYYGQVQLGMAILNLKKTDFIIYASFDQSIVVIPVELNLKFVNKMLSTLKKAYFCHMIHYVCIREGLVK